MLLLLVETVSRLAAIAATAGSMKSERSVYSINAEMPIAMTTSMTMSSRTLCPLLK